MSSDAWPSPDSPPTALPRIEDLPIAEQGYDQEAVRVAFDSFYRHAAQLDASLRALEAVEAFRRDADALRNDLRALRSIGLGLGGGGAEPSWATTSYERPRPEVPGVVLRLAAEVALLVAVAVVAGVAHFRPWVVVALMAAAFLVVALGEWLAARARFVPPAVAFLPPVEEQGEPAPYVEAPAPAWGPAVIEPPEDTEPNALAVVASSDEDDDPDEDEISDEDDEQDGERADPWEDGAADDEAEPEPEVGVRSGLFRRRRR